MMNKDVNVNYKLNDNNLYILKNLANNTITAKEGFLKIDGKLTGIRKNISNIGKLSMEGTNIKTESYVNKRELLRGLINVREPKQLSQEILNKENTLLQLELKEKDIKDVNNVISENNQFFNSIIRINFTIDF